MSSGEGAPRGQVLALMTATATTVPGIALKLSGAHPPDLAAAACYGLAIVGAAFLMAWGAEALQLDVSKGLALAVLALIAVLPEYAVDFTFAWKAGKNPDEFGPLALANMTGANRLLIGIGWSMVVLIAAFRIKSIAKKEGYTGELDTDVTLERSHSVEIAFLAIATAYSLTLPLKNHLTVVDTAVLFAIFLFYIVRISRAPAAEPHLVGPAQLIGRLPTRQRRLAQYGMLAYAAVAILLVAEPFAESLVSTGEHFGISTFLLVQWVAPLASEAPELLIAGLFAWRLNTGSGLGTLVSSKVNQWTLLVGSLPLVFAISASSLSGLPLDSLQREELFLTAAQSVFAIAILINRTINVREAWLLLGLFLGQFVLGGILPAHAREYERIGVGITYLVLAAFILWSQRQAIRPMFRDGLRTPLHEMIHEDAS